MPQSHGRFLLLSLLAAVLAGLAFLPGLPGDFVFDDIPNIVDNPAIHLKELNAGSVAQAAAASQLSGTSRLLPTLTFALDYLRAGGADPATFKTTNIAIHALTACALAWLFRSLLLVAGITGSRLKWLPLGLALAWAVHPLQVSSVLYVVQRLQAMGTLFLVLALIAYLSARRAQIAGDSGRTGFLLTALLWVVALGCKEDSTLLPAYTLALELTVLRFAAANEQQAGVLRRVYLFATLAGAAVFVLLVIPHYWSWEAYPGRDFSTAERLLTQCRMLAMYLWQIVAPLLHHMPFYYDWVQPSRGLLQPWTTLASLLLIAGLLAAAFRLRHRQPLFALGVFVFFGAHFITSNVVGLELAFEHRNHFGLIGAVLAVASLLGLAGQRMRLGLPAQAALCTLLLAALVTATLLRAHSWRDNMTLARTNAELAPHSARAWVFLCTGHYESGGGAVHGNPHLDKAIAACAKGAELAPEALNNPAVLVALKTLRGDVTPGDWDRFQHLLETADMSIDNRRAAFILVDFARKGIELDKRRLLDVMATSANRVDLKPFDLASFGYFIMKDLEEPDMAMPYFIRAIQASSPIDPFPGQLALEFRDKGRPDLAAQIERVGKARAEAASAAIRGTR